MSTLTFISGSTFGLTLLRLSRPAAEWEVKLFIALWLVSIPVLLISIAIDAGRGRYWAFAMLALFVPCCVFLVWYLSKVAQGVCCL